MDHILYKQVIRKGHKNDYIRKHEKCWQSLLREIKKAGISRELIWLDGNNVYIYMVSRDIHKALGKLTSAKVFKEWNAQMRPLLSLIQDSSGNKEIDFLQKVFDLESQLQD